jgi:hypothetical protein
VLHAERHSIAGFLHKRIKSKKYLGYYIKDVDLANDLRFGFPKML